MNPSEPRPSLSTKRSQPESLRAIELGVSLTVKDLTASVEWYRTVVGFHLDQKMEREGQLRAVALKAGIIRILLNQDDGAKGWERKKGEGFSMQLTTTQNIDDIAKRVKERGGSLEKEPADMPWGARVFTLRDPDGYKIAISSERKPA